MCIRDRDRGQWYQVKTIENLPTVLSLSLSENYYVPLCAGCEGLVENLVTYKRLFYSKGFLPVEEYNRMLIFDGYLDLVIC